MTTSRPELHAKPIATSSFSVEAIEAQLKAAWSELGMRADRARLPDPLRMSVLTLVVVARSNAETERARRILSSLVQALPSRIIFVSIRDDVAEPTAFVSTNCAFRSSDRPSCYEMIEIDTNPASVRAIPSVITQLEIPDLPTFAWWVGPVDFGSDEFRRISGTTERLIIDSSRFYEPLETIRGYHQFLEGNRDTLAGTDLTWSRLAAFRELLAQSFDNPIALAALSSLDRIDMTFDPGFEADALLTAGWISSRLGWEPIEATESRDTLTFPARRPDGGMARFNLSRISGTGIGLRSARLVAHTGQHVSRISVRRPDRFRAVVDIDMTGAPKQQRVVNCVDSDDHTVVGSELLQFTRDTIYESALDHAARFATMLDKEKSG